MKRPKTIADVEAAFVKVRCRMCNLGWHFAGFAPGSVACDTCDPLPDGRPRRHYHNRDRLKHPRKRPTHLVQGKWTQ